MTISTIKHIKTTSEGIELAHLEMISSLRGKHQIFQALCFGGIQSLLARTTQYAKLQSLLTRMKTEGREHEAQVLESSNRYLQAKDLAYAQAKRLAVIHSVAEQTDPVVLEFVPQMGRGSSLADLEKKASFSGMEVAQIQAIESKNALKRMVDANEASGLAEAMFYSVDITVPSHELNADENEALFNDRMEVFIHPEAILKALMRTREWLVSWNNPDYAELGLLKSDIEMVEQAVERFEHLQQASAALDGDVFVEEATDGTSRYKQVALLSEKLQAAVNE